MPIYEYQGQQYDITSDDPVAAKSKILNYLELQKTPAPVVPESTKPAGFSLKETAAALGQGVVGAGKSVTDVFGADNAASRYLEGKNKELESVYSPERRAEMAQREAKIAEAEKSGSLKAEIGAYLGAIVDAPVQSLAQGLGSIVPFLGTGVIGAIRGLGGPTVKALNTVVGAAMGAGTVKGSVYDAVKNELEKGGMKPEEAADRASKAQEYLGPNALQIMAGTALGGVGARYGVENLLQKGATDKLNAKLLPRVATAALAEAPLEGAQGGQEKLAQNLALQKEGFNVPTMQGVLGSTARDAALGALTAGAVGVRGPGAKPSQPGQTPTPEAVTPETQAALAAEAPVTDPLLMPTIDANGQFTQAATIQPEAVAAAEVPAPEIPQPITETAEAETDKIPAPKAVETEVAVEPIKNAIDYLAKVDSGSQIKQSEYRQVAKALGLKIPVGTTNVNGVQLIKDFVTKQGVTNAPATDDTANRVGTEIPSATGTGTATTGVSPNDNAKLAGDQSPVGDNINGATEQLSPLTQQGEPNAAQATKTQQIETPTEKKSAAPIEEPIVSTETTEINYNNGDKYVGEVKNGLAHGYGKITYADGTEHEGLFRDNAAVNSDQYIKDQIKNRVKKSGKEIAEEFELAKSALTKSWEDSREKTVAKIKDLSDEYEQLSKERDQLNVDPALVNQYAKDRSNLTKEQKTAVERYGQLYRKISFIDEKIKGFENETNYATLSTLNLPKWENLSQFEKYEFLRNLKSTGTSGSDYDAAVKALINHRNKASYRDLQNTQKLEAIDYDFNRSVYMNRLKTDFPVWADLPVAAKDIYLENIKDNTIEDQDIAFKKVAEHFKKEGNLSFEEREKATLAQTNKNAYQTAQERIAKEAAAAESAQGKGVQLTKDTKEKLIAGNITGVLIDLEDKARGFNFKNRENVVYKSPFIEFHTKLRQKTSSLTFKSLAAALSKLQFNSKVVTDPENKVIKRLESENKLAEYDPKTDTFYFTSGGMDEATVLHEIVHAGTVRIINQYFTDPSKLTAEQREAVEHLEKIYEFSKKRLGGKFKNAHENLYEFISYALTDNKFQLALSEIQARSLSKYTKFTDMMYGLWSQFTRAIAGALYIDTPRIRKGEAAELNPFLYHEFAREWGAINKDELYVATDDPTEDVYEMLMFLEESPVLEKDLEKDKKTRDEKVEIKTQKVVKQAKKFLNIKEGFEGNLLLETSQIFGQILLAPKKGIKVAPLASKVAEETEAELRDAENILVTPGQKSDYDFSEKEKPVSFIKAVKSLGTRIGWRNAAEQLQNDRYHVKYWENEEDLANRINYDTEKGTYSNINGRLTLSVGIAKNLFSSKVEPIYNNLNKAIYNFAKAVDQSVEDAVKSLHLIMEALHEPERRAVIYMMGVPLSTDANIPQNGKMISAADRRAQIMSILDNNKTLTEAQAKALRAELDAFIYTTNTQGEKVVNSKYVTPYGSSPIGSKEIDINSGMYAATGITPKAAAIKLEKFNNAPFKPEAEEVFKQMRELHKVTTEINKQSNYWSKPVSNRVSFYGFNNYIPLKGVAKHTVANELVDFDGEMMGGELADITTGDKVKARGKEGQDIAYGMEGRVSVSYNPILQSMADAVRSTLRAGYHGVTTATKNAIDQKTLVGKITNYTFQDRKDRDVIKALPRENTIFHHNEDGSIDVIEIQNRKIRESIRRTFEDVNPLINALNNITSTLGQFHTRYNFNFAPLNFVRDTLTNAWVLGAEFGPGMIGQVAAKVVNGSLPKAMKVVRLYQNKDFGQLEALAKKDSTVKDMVDYIKTGGMVEYLQGLSLKSSFDKLRKEVGSSGVLTSKEQLDKVVDIWTDMFELASRGAAFSVVKNNYMKEGKLSEAEATNKAAAYVKNLANFEQVGKMGKTLGAVFMFYRPSATGAVRSIEALLPAFQNVDKMVLGLPSNFTEQDKQAYKENFKTRQKYARYMIGGLMGAGALAYTMALMMAGDDDLGRNKVMNDDMSQWNRFWRLHTPFSDTPFQLPWGFGLGSFLASGAQLAAVLTGQQTFLGAMSNITTQITLDSFIPIPFSRMDVTENPALWVLDSMTPSMLRPALEFVVNKNGLGQDIYNDSSRRMGDAFLGGDHIPQMYKDIAEYLIKATGGAIDWSPNSIYFLANSYADGPARVIDTTVNSMYLAAGEKEFKAKTDIPFIGSFIGAAPNIDSREFTKIEKQVEEKARILESLESSPQYYIERLQKYPLDEEIVAFYDKEVNGRLKELRAEAKQIRGPGGDLSPKDKTLILKEITNEQNLIKWEMVQQFKAYGMEP